MTGAVVDASVVLKWYLADEALGDTALRILHRYVAAEIQLAAPSLLVYEIINGLIMAQRRGRIDAPVIDAAIEGFIHLGIPLTDITPLHKIVVDYSRKYGISVYDAAYLAVAAQEQAVFITADDALYAGVANDLAWVIRLADAAV